MQRKNIFYIDFCIIDVEIFQKSRKIRENETILARI